MFFPINWQDQNAMLVKIDKEILKRIRKASLRVGSIVGKANRMDMAYALTNLKRLDKVNWCFRDIMHL